MRRIREEEEELPQRRRKNRPIGKPYFDPGLIVTARSLVTDTNGVGWWVDPDDNSLKRAVVFKPRKS